MNREIIGRSVIILLLALVTVAWVPTPLVHAVSFRQSLCQRVRGMFKKSFSFCHDRPQEETESAAYENMPTVHWSANFAQENRGLGPLQNSEPNIPIAPDNMPSEPYLPSNSLDFHSGEVHAMNSLINLPGIFNHDISQSHDLIDSRPPPHVSKSLSALILRASSTLQIKYHAKFPLPSILFCISHEDDDCLAYWTPSIHELTDRQVFVIVVALTLDPWYVETSKMKAFLSAIYPRLSFESKYLIRKLSLFKFMDSKLRPLEYHLPPSGDHVFPELARLLCNKFTPLFKYVVYLMEKESNALEAYLDSAECAIRNHEAIEAHRQKYNRLFSLFYDEFMDPETTPSRIVFIIREFLRFADMVVENCLDAYREFTKNLIHQMDSLQNLDSSHGPIDQDSQFCEPSESFYVRVIDQARYPFMSFKLGKAAIDHRRLDVLTTMIRDEGFLYFSSPSLIQLRGESSSTLLGNEEYNILLYTMHSLLKRGTNAPQPTHASVGPSAFQFLQLILENGGLRLVYPEFLTHATHLHDIKIMRYLVHDLGIKDGLDDAIAACKVELNEPIAESIAHFLFSEKLRKHLHSAAEAAHPATGSGVAHFSSSSSSRMDPGADEVSGYF